MPESWTYKLKPDLPPPPDWLLSKIDREFRPEVNDQGYLGVRHLNDWKGRSYPAPKNVRRYFCEEYLDWVRESITPSFQNGGLMYCRADAEHPSTGAHTDGTRDYVLLYNVETGGPEAELCFWRENGRPLIRERMSKCESTRELELIDSVKGPAGVWYLLNTRILHSVENLSGLRLNLQVSFDVELPKELA